MTTTQKQHEMEFDLDAWLAIVEIPESMSPGRRAVKRRPRREDQEQKEAEAKANAVFYAGDGDESDVAF